MSRYITENSGEFTLLAFLTGALLACCILLLWAFYELFSIASEIQHVYGSQRQPDMISGGTAQGSKGQQVYELNLDVSKLCAQKDHPHKFVNK